MFDHDHDLNEEHELAHPLDHDDFLLGTDLWRSGFGGSFPKDRRFRTLFAWSVSAFMMFFLLVFFAWLWVAVLFDTGFHDAIVGQAVISSPQSPGYADFMLSPGETPDLPPYYEYWYFFNLTNAEDVRLRGRRPHVAQVGPYVYSMVKKKYNMSWSPDETVINYRECESWIYVPELTCAGCDPDKDIIFNVNPGYMGAIANAGGELPLTQAFTGPSMGRVFSFLETVFVQDTVAWTSTGVLASQEQLLGGPSDQFFATWANATVPPDAQWDAMLVSAQSGQPSGISLASAQLLFSPAHPYSLLNPDPSAYRLWAQAAPPAADTLAANATQDARALLQATFALSAQQTAMVCDWLRAQFWPASVVPPLLSQHGVPCLQYLAYVQWGTGAVSPTAKDGQHLSVQELYPARGFLAKPEFALWGDDSLPSQMAWQDAVKLWGDLTTCGPTGRPDLGLGLFNANNWAVFALYAGAPANLTMLDDTWGIKSGKQLRLLELYFADMADKFAQPDMAELAEIGGGVITFRTVNQWAWQAIDPLLVFLKPLSSDVALQPNITTDFQCFHDIRTRIASYYTGKGDISQVGGTISYGGMTQFPPDWYNASYPPYQIHGTNSEGQFEPFFPAGQDIQVFDNNFMRTLTLNHVDNVTIKGVFSYRFTLSPSNFYSPNYPFNMNDPNFQGFANLSGPQQGGMFFFFFLFIFFFFFFF